jgi:hypothetical protein
MRYRRHWIAACAAIACVIAVTGCGGAADPFKAHYEAAVLPLHQTFADLASTFIHAPGKTTAEIAQSLGVLSDRLGRQLAPLEALKPPRAVAIPFRALTTSLNRVAGDLRATYVAVTHHDVAAAQPAIVSLQRDARVATDASAAVKDKLDHK